MSDYEEPENTILMELEAGLVVINLLEKVAPQHCARFKTLARKGAYDNVCFHRVIEDFMAQSGDVEYGNMEKNFDLGRAGRGRSDLPNVPAEFSRLPHMRGALGAARSFSPNSANSQFFINYADNDHLNGKYTVFGQVISGLEFIDALAHGEPPLEPDRMVRVRVAADV